MNTYKVGVCRIGYVKVQADSEEEAKNRTSYFLPEQITWVELSGQISPFLITYVELVKD